MATKTLDRIEDAYKTAMDAARAAYSPQETPAGRLCWSGRIQRALKLHKDATAAGELDRAKEIAAGIDLLDRKAKEALSAANEAKSLYHGLVAARGGKLAEIKVPPCTCEGCTVADAQAAFFKAESDLRRVVFDLLKPEDATESLSMLSKLLETQQQDRLSRMLADIDAAQRRYVTAAKAYNRQPDWHAAFR